MKQKIYILGLVTALLVFVGAIFKINHWPAAGVLMTCGLIMLVWIFLPLALVNNYKAEGNSRNRALYIVTWITCLVVFTGMLFKVMHWPNAGVMLAIALPFPYVVFLPVFVSVTSKNKNFNIYNTVFILFLLVVQSVFSTLLALNVSLTRIDDSYGLSRSYNKIGTVLEEISPATSRPEVTKRIDEVIKTIDEYRSFILKDEDITIEEWHNNPGMLRRPESRQVGMVAFEKAGNIPAKLRNEFKDLIALMKQTKGCEGLAGIIPEMFDFKAPDGDESQWVLWKFKYNNLSWVMIYLDGLRTNLLLIRTSISS